MALLLCFTFMIIEFVGGILANRCSFGGTISMFKDIQHSRHCLHRLHIPSTLHSCFPCSLAIMTDAAHLLSDVSGFGVSLWAAWYAARKSRTTHTFGYHRVEVGAELQQRLSAHLRLCASLWRVRKLRHWCAQVLGALASVLSIWLVTGILVYEAIDRVVNPVRVNGKGAVTMPWCCSSRALPTADGQARE